MNKMKSNECVHHDPSDHAEAPQPWEYSSLFLRSCPRTLVSMSLRRRDHILLVPRCHQDQLLLVSPRYGRDPCPNRTLAGLSHCEYHMHASTF